MGKAKKSRMGRRAKHRPLEIQLREDEEVKPSYRNKGEGQEEGSTEYVEHKLSQQILREVRAQQKDIEEEFPSLGGMSKEKQHKLAADSDDDDEVEGAEAGDDAGEQLRKELDLDPADTEALKLFMNSEKTNRQTLNDMILDKIAEKKTEITTQLSDDENIQLSDVDPRVIEMYEGVKEVLCKYRSGKLPKAFKIIPSLRNWEQILCLTEPQNWTAASMYQATRIFTCNLREKMAQRFFNLVLLPRVRDDIQEFKKLNFHLFQALMKAQFKPGAFFKGILIPLCQSGTCTLREALIIGSVLAKNSIPVLHSSAALLNIAEMEYSGSNSIFIRILLEKKYALPFRVIDGLVHHFLKFQFDKRELPVLWHQAFLTLVQRYKLDISSEQKEALLDLIKVHKHHKMTGEIRRELRFSKCRDEEDEEMAVI